MNKKKVAPGQKLSAELDCITDELSNSDKEQERSQRTQMLAALTKYAKSRFDLGQALASYNQACTVDRIWLRASDAISKHINVSQRTLFRILADYERVSGTLETVLSAMGAEGFDPAKRKNASLSQEITEAMADDPSPEEAQGVVRHTAASMKQRKGQDPMSADERVVWGLRQDIRKWLNAVPEDRQWSLLQRAICEEAFEVWGVTDPWTTVFTPQPGARTLDGLERQAREMAA